jgi:nucleotide-binding universal stress UspA family protein
MEILFATDGRPPAVAAGELLRRLVAQSHVDVTVLHASEFGNEVVAERHVQDIFAAAEASLGGAGIPTHMVLTEGDPAGSIGKELAQGAHQLTVIGAGNHTWLGRLVLGSVSTHVLHVAPTPVLIVHRGPSVEHDRLKVLIGADGSPGAMQAIDTLTSITEPDRVDIRVRTVIPTPDLAFATHPGAYVPSSFIEEAQAREKVIASRHLHDALEHLRLAGFSAHGSIGAGWPANDLLEYAQTVEADLIVVGARGIGAIARMTMGSVSAHVAGHAPAALVAHAQAHPMDERAIEESHGPEVPLGPDKGSAS